MKKVVLAVLMAASKEGTNCEISLSTKGGHVLICGSIQLGDTTKETLDLIVLRSGFKSDLSLSPDESDLSVGTNDGKYEIGVGSVCITFQDKFQRDPFTVTANA